MPTAIGIPLTEEVFDAMETYEKSLYEAFFTEAERLTTTSLEDGESQPPSDVLIYTYQEIVEMGGEHFCPVRQIALIFSLCEIPNQTVH